jgi:hypothetical protein
MKKTIAALLATTTLAAVLGSPVWSFIRGPSDDRAARPVAAVFDDTGASLPWVFVSGDDDDHDDDHDDEDDDDDCDDDDDEGRDCRESGRNAPLPGIVGPPKNGLFGNGAPPKAQMN